MGQTNNNNAVFSFAPILGVPFEVDWATLAQAAILIAPLSAGSGNASMFCLCNGATGSLGLYSLDSTNGQNRQYISLDASGIINMQLNNGAASFQISTAGVLTMNGPSGLNININSATGALKILGTQVVAARITGWAAATNVKAKTTFDTSTVTLPILAAHVGQMIDDLMTHGLIGT
jgi:hypothetical protein